MSIEQELAEAYRQSAARLKRSSGLDRRINQLYQDQRHRVKGSKSTLRKTRMVQLAVLVIMIVSVGFSAPYLVQFRDKVIHFVMLNQEVSTYDVMKAQSTRVSIEQIREELRIGERALFYSEELRLLLPKTHQIPYVIVSKPRIWTEKEAWEKQVMNAGAAIRLPDQIDDGLVFQEGFKELPYGGTLSMSDLKLVEQLQQQIGLDGKTEVWEILPGRDHEEHPIFTTVYSMSTKAALNFTIEIFKEKTDLKMVASQTEHEQVKVSGKHASYISTENFLLHPSNQYRSLVWLDTREQQSIMYTLGSGDAVFTKDKLIGLAQHFMSQP